MKNQFLLFYIVTILNLYVNAENLNENNLPKDYYHPIILIPGDGGSKAYFKSDNTLTQVWFSLKYMLLPAYLNQLFKLNSSIQFPNDLIHFPGWGSTESIENLSDWSLSKTQYFGNLVKKLLENSYYKRNFTLRGAPYDFRKAPFDNKEFMKNFPKLIEETYHFANGSKVVLVAHSMGTLYVLHSLNKMKKSWKRRYIKAFVALGAPIGGSVKALLLELSGHGFGIPRKDILFRDLERSFTSTSYLIPKPGIFPFDRTLVITPTRNYTSADYDVLFKDIKYKDGFRKFLRNQRYYDVNDALSGIRHIHCVHGTYVDTPSRLKYTNYDQETNSQGSFVDTSPTILFENGDGSVNIESLELCKFWRGVNYKTVVGVDHKSIINNHKVIKLIIKLAKLSDK